MLHNIDRNQTQLFEAITPLEEASILSLGKLISTDRGSLVLDKMCSTLEQAKVALKKTWTKKVIIYTTKRISVSNSIGRYKNCYIHPYAIHSNEYSYSVFQYYDYPLLENRIHFDQNHFNIFKIGDRIYVPTNKSVASVSFNSTVNLSDSFYELMKE